MALGEEHERREWPASARYLTAPRPGSTTGWFQDIAVDDWISQFRAARRLRVATVTRGVAYCLGWLVFGTASVAISAREWSAAAAFPVCVALLTWCRRVAARARKDVRSVDETVGIPVPADLVGRITGNVHLLCRIGEYVEKSRAEARRAGETIIDYPHAATIGQILREYPDCLHRVRRLWTAGDEARWRTSAAQLLVMGDRMREILHAIDVRSWWDAGYEGTAFRFPAEYEPDSALSEEVDRLRSQRRHRTALDAALRVLLSDGGTAGAYAVALVLCIQGSDRTHTENSAEPITREQLASPLLAPIATECTSCLRFWFSSHQMLGTSPSFAVSNPAGLQCQSCRYTLCRRCLPPRDGRGCPRPDCNGLLDVPVLATGRTRGVG